MPHPNTPPTARISSTSTRHSGTPPLSRVRGAPQLHRQILKRRQPNLYRAREAKPLNKPTMLWIVEHVSTIRPT
jgi:hypothetical protein